MPWGRLDDGLYDHPKLDELGKDRLPAVGLWALAISWCNRRLTDGFVPAERIRLLGGSPALANRLVVVGMFDRDGHDYRIHDFLEFNDSRADVEARRAADAERKRKSRGLSTPESTSESTSASATESQVESRMESIPESARSHTVTRARPHDRARPGPARPIENEKVPSPLGTRGNGTGTHSSTVTLSVDDVKRWNPFGHEWDALRVAWVERGLTRPPTDDQRELLWQILDARPTDIVRWVREAPKSAKSGSEVVRYVLEQWRAVRTEAGGVDETPGTDDAGPSKGEASESLAEIMARL